MKKLAFLICFIPYFSEGQWITDSIEIDQKLKYITDLEELSIVYAPNGLGCSCNDFFYLKSVSSSVYYKFRSDNDKLIYVEAILNNGNKVKGYYSMRGISCGNYELKCWVKDLNWITIDPLNNIIKEEFYSEGEEIDTWQNDYKK